MFDETFRRNLYFIGSFVTEIHPIDQDWAYGETFGMKGAFPLNFVWKINKDLLSVSL